MPRTAVPEWSVRSGGLGQNFPANRSKMAEQAQRSYIEELFPIQPDENQHVRFQRLCTRITNIIHIEFLDLAINNYHLLFAPAAALLWIIVRNSFIYFESSRASLGKTPMRIEEPLDTLEYRMATEDTLVAGPEKPEKIINDSDHGTRTPETKEPPRTITGWKVSIPLNVYLECA